MSSIAGNSYSLPSINNREADRKRAEGRQGFLEVATRTGGGRVGRGGGKEEGAGVVVVEGLSWACGAVGWMEGGQTR